MREGHEQVTEYLLVLGHPLLELRICDGWLVLRLLLSLHREELLWWARRWVNEVHDLGTPQRRHDLELPYGMIIFGQLLRNRKKAKRRERMEGCGGGG